MTTDNNTFVENNTASNFSNQNAEKTPKEKFNHYNGNTEINGANIKTEFELGKWRAEAYSTDPEKKAKAEEMKQNFQQKIADKYNKMNPEQRKYWKQEYEKSLAIENGKPRTTEVQQRIDALNVGLAKINEISKKEEPKIIKDPNKIVKSPVTVADYQHNITVRENELKILNAKKEEILKKYDNEYYKQNSNNKLLENYTAERYKIEDKIRDTKKEIKIQQKKKEDQLTKEIVKNSKEEKNERSVATELNGIRTY